MSVGREERDVSVGREERDVSVGREEREGPYPESLEADNLGKKRIH